jgi:hypothetical protein
MGSISRHQRKGRKNTGTYFRLPVCWELWTRLSTPAVASPTIKVLTRPLMSFVISRLAIFVRQTKPKVTKQNARTGSLVAEYPNLKANRNEIRRRYNSTRTALGIETHEKTNDSIGKASVASSAITHDASITAHGFCIKRRSILRGEQEQPERA